MVSNLVLQTIGIALMASGSILAIEGLWRKRVKKSIYKTKSLLKRYKEFFENKDKILKEATEKILNEHKKLAELSHGYANFEFIIEYMAITGIALNEVGSIVKLRALKFLERHLIYIGMICIIIGAIMQGMGLWL